MPNQQSVTLCGEKLSGPRHICAFFDSKDEQYEVLMPYFQEGLDQGEEVISILESDTHVDHHHRLTAAGLPVQQASESGQLKILASEDTYLKDNIFVSQRMYTMLEDVLSAATGGPFGTVRTCGDMEWALRNLPGTDELMMYEARVNLLTPKYDCTLLCAYDINRFSGRAVADILATHSHVILNGRIHHNPHFAEPLPFLQELLHRRPRPLSKIMA